MVTSYSTPSVAEPNNIIPVHPLWHCVGESLGTASGVQRKHDAMLRMVVLYFLWDTPRELEEATLLVKIGTKMV